MVTLQPFSLVPSRLNFFPDVTLSVSPQLRASHPQVILEQEASLSPSLLSLSALPGGSAQHSYTTQSSWEMLLSIKPQCCLQLF